MRILLIDVNCKAGSTGQIVYNLFSRYNSRGDTAAVCYGRGAPIDEKGIYKFGLDWETGLHALLTRLTGLTGCYSFFSTRRLLRFLDDFQPDVVHIHELHAYFVNIPTLLRYLAKKNIRVIHTLHCEFSYTGKCGHSVDCRRWEQECGKCPRLRAYPASWFFDFTKKMLRGKKEAFGAIGELIVAAPSAWLAERAKRSFFKNRQIVTIPNGIDAELFYPRDTGTLREKYGIGPEEKVVLALAPHLMSEGKGGRHVLKLAGKVGDAARFVMIGIDGETERTEGKLIRLGPIFDKELLAQFYSLADLFVICSLRENFPTTCIEAQLCGTPICGFDTGGTKETAVFKDPDAFVEYGDLEGLAQRILDAEKKTEQVSRKLAGEARERFGSDAMAERYRALYQQDFHP